MNLDELRKAVEAKYSGLEMQYGTKVTEKVTLRAAIRLQKHERNRLADLAKSLQGEEGKEQDEDAVLKALLDMLRIVADSPEGAEQLILAMNSDLATIVTLWAEYQAATDPGEA